MIRFIAVSLSAQGGKMTYYKEYMELINDSSFDKQTKQLLIQSYCVGFADGKSIAFKEAVEIISNPKKQNGKIES